MIEIQIVFIPGDGKDLKAYICYSLMVYISMIFFIMQQWQINCFVWTESRWCIPFISLCMFVLSKKKRGEYWFTQILKDADVYL